MNRPPSEAALSRRIAGDRGEDRRRAVVFREIVLTGHLRDNRRLFAQTRLGGASICISLRNKCSARFPARLASVIVSKKVSERSIGLVLPARYISHLHDFGAGALFFTTTEKSACSIMTETLSDHIERLIEWRGARVGLYSLGHRSYRGDYSCSSVMSPGCCRRRFRRRESEFAARGT
jgi:hypothetical protein